MTHVPFQHPDPRRPRGRARKALLAGLVVAPLVAPTAAQAGWNDLGEVFAGHYATVPGTQGVPLAVNGRGEIAAAIGPNDSATDVTLARRTIGGRFDQSDGVVEGQTPYLARAVPYPAVMAADGSALALWNRPGEDVVLSSSTTTTGWTAPASFRALVGISPSEGGDLRALVTKALPDGSVLAVFRGMRDNDDALRTAVRSPAGVWGSATLLTTTAGRLLDVLVDPAGNATVVWRNVASPGSNARTEGFRSQRRLADGTWQPVRLFPKDRIAASAQTVFAVDGYGNVIVAYTGSDDPDTTTVPPRTRLLKVATLKPGHDWSATQNVAAAAGDPDATSQSDGRWGLSSPNLAATRYGSVLLTYSDRTTGVLYGVLGDSEQHWGSPFTIADGREHVGGVQAVENPVQGSISMTWNAQEASEPAVPIARDVYPWDGTLSRRYRVPTFDDGRVDNRIATTDRGDTVVPYEAYGHLRVIVDDASGPALSNLSVPTAPAPGTVGSLSATAVDAYSKVDHLTWDFGDGSSARGDRVQHAWKASGTYPVSVTAVDEHGNPATTSTVVRVGPVSAATRAKALRPAGPVRVSGVRIRKGLLTFDASGPAAMNVAIQRRSVERVRANGRVRRVARYTPAGALQVDARVAGPVRARVAALRRASGYRLIVTRRGETGPPVRQVVVLR